MVLSVFLHMARVFYHGAYKPPREFNWVIGVILLTLTLLLSFTGYLLPWDQLALWAVTVGTNMMGYTPVFGSQVRFVLLGGVEIGSETLLRWYVLHVLDAAVRHRDLHGDPLLASPQGRRHLGAALMIARFGLARRPFGSPRSTAPRRWRFPRRDRLRRPRRWRFPRRRPSLGSSHLSGGRMTEIPEHLRKRAEEARAKAAAEKGEAAASETPTPEAPVGGDAAPTSEAASRIPAHLLERSRAAKARSEGGGEEASGGGVAVAERPAGVAAAVPTAGLPVGAGPGGHTQRLLTVVKSGSIQEVKATPVDKVHTWPHLLIGEFVAALACTAFVFVFSIFVNAPLLQLANLNRTPNPSKAPWYFLGLQELLTMFHPMVAGVTIPGMGMFVPDARPLHRQQPEQQAGGSQVRHLHIHDLPHVLGRTRHHRLVLPWPRASTSPCPGVTASSSSSEVPQMSSTTIIIIVIAVVVVLAVIAFVTAARRGDVRAAPGRCPRDAPAQGPQLACRRRRSRRWSQAASIERAAVTERCHRARAGSFRAGRRMVAAGSGDDRRHPAALPQPLA